ncbi:bifunctional 2-polyprenyl-6-hydroxyphenol methylase/3-demethylubiquinol 3-O-methyltransferase UbiG [Streptomyces atriruber]|uniref:bifunctional 2-polyprenyl-6-hydroxyphenol methylase/3-demethylubiquinol 3-O-methyltransferase UbiG n=1 Tax=Streptomyces atriruber TaxID=545121 RepID=UPI0006E42DA6|nr:bifunctional 2-polyprenyl-6-hydroxyphenol methylase/3-demethylubiquinol 3-O-methyltransferase UbiG [Streptomyces atriruber]
MGTVATAPAIDNEYYDEVGEAWWDSEGPFRALHEMNPVRLGHFHETLGGHYPDRAPGDLRVLDLGCGGGLLSEGLARRGYRVTGIDISEPSLAVARAHAARHGVEVEYRSGSAYALPCPDASFDAVTASDIFEHLDDLEQALAEIHRVLKPGGTVLFDTINRTARSYLVSILLAQRLLKVVHPGTHVWRMFIRPATLRRKFGAAGLRPASVAGMVPARPLPGVLLSLLRGRGLGGFAIADDLSNSYIGHAVKGRPLHENRTTTGGH